MFDFIRKPFLWNAWNRKLDDDFINKDYFRLKFIQDLAVYDIIRDAKGKRIAEIGGGKPRILETLAKHNECYNVDKFEGHAGGPKGIKPIAGIKNVRTFLGERSGKLQENFFDIVFSVSVVEHVPADGFQDFLEEGIAILKPGGLWVHAIDIYLEDEPSAPWRERYERYRSWLDHPQLRPVGPVFDGPLKFTCDMASNPDDVVYRMGKIAPSLIELRQGAQSVGIIAALEKTVA